MTGVHSLPKTVTRQRHGSDLNPGLTASESSTLTTRLPSHPCNVNSKQSRSFDDRPHRPRTCHPTADESILRPRFRRDALPLRTSLQPRPAAVCCLHCQLEELPPKFSRPLGKSTEKGQFWGILLLTVLGWLGSQVVSVLDSGAVGPEFKSQSRRRRVTVLGN